MSCYFREEKVKNDFQEAEGKNNDKKQLVPLNIHVWQSYSHWKKRFLWSNFSSLDDVCLAEALYESTTKLVGNHMGFVYENNKQFLINPFFGPVSRDLFTV